MVEESKAIDNVEDDNSNKITNKKEEIEEKNKTYDLDKFNELFDFLMSKKDEVIKSGIDILKPYFVNHIENKLKNNSLSEKYKIIFLIEDNTISQINLDLIYASLTEEENKDDLLLILNSPGGHVAPAYLISKCCKEYFQNFAVAIPRRAKSAATLIALGAHNIHMGSISELGPIDIQLNRLSSLALGEAVSYIAKIVEEHPGASNMFAQYLNKELNLERLGETKRTAESTIDYAERLLNGKNLPKTPQEISQKLVNGYKDHGFVIDKDEASEIFGDIVKHNTQEYLLANDIYKFIESIKLILWVVFKEQYEVSWAGTSSNLWIKKRDNQE